MKRYLIQNKEVFIVSYVIEAENPDQAVQRWRDGEENEIDIDYLADLSDYTRHAIPDVQEIIEDL